MNQCQLGEKLCAFIYVCVFACAHISAHVHIIAWSAEHQRGSCFRTEACATTGNNHQIEVAAAASERR